MDKVCLVEDDPTINELIGKKLRAKGYDVSVFETVESARRAQSAWDLYILDILLPGKESGLDYCESLRERSPATPILILSALSEPADRIQGLKSGADDYLTKPFEMEELLLRVQGMLNRRFWYAKHPKDQSVFRWGENSIDFVNYEGRSGDYRFVLGQKECMLMKLLIEKEGEVVSRDLILDQVWGYNVFPSTRTVDNFIVKLRKCFEKTPSEPKYIHSVRGLGYKFTSS